MWRKCALLKVQNSRNSLGDEFMRHGSAGRFPTRADVILNRYDLFGTDFLGAGSESRVYAIDAQHVLRIYNEQIAWDYVEARRHFYSELAKEALPFALSEIYTVGAWVGHIYTTEKRIPGQDFSKALPTLVGADRAKALMSYLDAAAALGNVRYPDKLYGELIADSRLQSASWQGYLTARMEETLADSRPDLEADVSGFNRVLASIYEQLPILGDNPPKSLVHGDYWPANVLIGDDLAISGVVDFSYATVVGDARMDLAGASFFLETAPPYNLEDTEFLRRLLAERHGEEFLEVVDFYRLYYSIFFSGCKADDPSTYWWCVKNLRAAAER